MARDLDTIKEELRTEYPILKSGDRVFEEEEYNETIDAWAEETRASEIDKETNGYKYDREAAYASIQDQLDMQYWDEVNGTTTWKDHIAQVKADNPKP